MFPTPRRPLLRALGLTVALGALAACDETGKFDIDLRQMGNGFDTSAAARAAAPKPQPDERGIVSYPTYQVAIARRGDTVTSVAGRLGLDPNELARYNAIRSPDLVLRSGEILALPSRVAEPSVATGALPGSGGIDVATIAGGAIERAESSGRIVQPAPAAPAAAEPIRHKVVRGETAYSIARLYNVSIRSLADWNGLGSDLAVREGQYLLIPTAAAAAPRVAEAEPTQPGQGSAAPPPPSAAEPLPAEKTAPAAQPAAKPASPDLASQKTEASGSARLAFPVTGKIIRPYQKKKNEGIDISAAAGTAVRAAEDGTVAAITRDTDQVPILVIRHADNLLTVYANIDAITVEKGAAVKRGQAIAKVRTGDPAFLHFEVRQGFDSVDPVPYLQ